MRILLVEPDLILGKTCTAALEQAGHDVRWAQAAQQAIHVADEMSPEVVVLELQLPGHSGIEFIYEFRSYSDWQKTPIIVYTFIAQQNIDIVQLERLGIKGYYYKPTTSLLDLKRAVADAVTVGV